MKKLLEMARELGCQIVAHERTVLLKKAQKQVHDDPMANELIRDYQDQAQKVRQLEQEQKPIEVADKHKLQEIEEKISVNVNLKEMTKRQVDFVEMMRKVKETIDKQLEIEEEQAEQQG